MINFIFRLFSFGMSTFLRIFVAVTNNTYFMAMDIFVIMADILRNTRYALPDPDSVFHANRNGNVRQIAFTNHIRPNSSLSHTYTQTEQCLTLSCDEREKSSNTDIYILNLDTSKKITITHKNIGSNSRSMKTDDQCQNSKTKVKHSQIESIEYDYTFSASDGDEVSNSSLCSSSNMSIENDVSDGQILQFSHITKDKDVCDRSSRSTEENPSHNCENKSDDTTDERDDFEVDSQKTELLETNDEDGITCIQKTSSPIRKSTNFSFLDPCNQLENTSIKIKRELEELSSDTTEESSTSDGFETRANFFENTILLNDSARRRLSLPASFNTSNEAVSHFEAIKNKIEETIKNTSRHEKSMREIKYPLLSETYLSKDNEEAKEIFSCSSYESLPVSEHLHNAFEKSTFFSLYREDCISTSTPDFSSVDKFVEAVNKLKSTLSVSELIKYKNPVPFTLSTDSKGEMKRLMRAHSCEIMETNSQVNDSDVLCNSVDSKTVECVSSSQNENDRELRKNYLMTCSDETFSEEMHQLIKSMFDKMMSDLEDIELNTSERDDIKDDITISECENNFIETTKPGSFQSPLTEPLECQQDQTIIEEVGMRFSHGQNDIDKKMDVSNLDNKLAKLSPDESSENTINYEETNSPVTIYEKQTLTDCEAHQKASDPECLINLHSDETSKFLPPKVSSDTSVKIRENYNTLDQSFVSVTETDNEFKISEESSKTQFDEDERVNITNIDNLERDDGKKVISKTCYRNDSLGNDNFLSFAEENSFYNNSNLEDSTWTLKELTCK